MLSFSVWRAMRHGVSRTFKSEVIPRPWCLCTVNHGASSTALCSKQSSFVSRLSGMWKSGNGHISVRQLSNSTETEAETRWWMEMEENPEKANQERRQLKLSGSTTLYDFKQKVLAASSWDWTNSDWQEFEETVLSEREKFSRIWEAVCMSLLFHRGFMEGGLSLMEYIRSKGRSPNIATLTSYIALCGECGGKSQQHLVFECYEEIMKISSLFDGQSCKCLIVGLCGTDRWKEAIPYLEMARLSQNPKSGHYSPIAQAAFKNGDIQKGLEIMTEMGDNSLEPHDKAFLAIIEACASDENEMTFQTLFEYLRKYSWFPSTEIMRSLIRACRSSSLGKDWRFTFTKADSRGACKACGHQARQVDLSVEQFKELQENFISKAVVGKDVFLKTSPIEMKEFLDFLEKTAPCDVVLDALNIAFRQRAQLSSKQKMELVHSVVDYFWRRDRRVMLLGRKHMLGWSPREMSAVRRKAHCFFAENISQDDPFLLHAALSSGRDTVFVSNDEMRDHKHLLGPRLGAVFKQWQRSRQIYFLGVDHKTRRLRFQMPKAYDTLAQEDAGGWHVPYENQADRVSFQHPNSWLCIRQKR